MTLGEALAAGTRSLARHHVPSPRLDAEILLAHSLGQERTYLLTHRDHELAPAVRQRYDSMLLRRGTREPLQYITGVQEFFGRTFDVNPSVLIPRPETELVVETALRLNTWLRPRILDLGTGSGCIAVTLALEVPDARVFAADLSTESLDTARHNSRKLGASVRFCCMDTLDAWGGDLELVVSNPPYVGANEKPGLQPEVGDFEPPVALFGIREPAAFYRRLFTQTRDRLVGGGLVIVEIGFTMEPAVRGMLSEAWEILPTVNDLQGIPRVVAARKRAER